MVDKVRFDEDAKRDLHRAKCFLDTIDKSEKFLDDLESLIAMILLMPLAFQIRYKEVRIVKLNHFSYSIHYTIYDNEIVILNILNHFQDF